MRKHTKTFRTDGTFIGIRVPPIVAAEIDKKAGHWRRSDYIRAAIAEKLAREADGKDAA